MIVPSHYNHAEVPHKDIDLLYVFEEECIDDVVRKYLQRRFKCSGKILWRYHPLNQVYDVYWEPEDNGIDDAEKT